MSRIQSIALAITVIVAVVAGMLLSRALLQPGTAVPVLTAGTLLDPPKPLPPMSAISTHTAGTEADAPASPADTGSPVTSTDAPASGSPASAASSAAGFIDQDRRAFGLDRLEGRWSLMFFGFTNCPDVCPMTLGTLAQVEKQLMDLPPAQRPQVILVSVDARRDTPEQLASYVRFFGPSFTGITAPQEVVEDFARRMGVVVAITPLAGGGTQDGGIQEDGVDGDGKSGYGGNYTIDHSASIFLIDPRGAMRALFSPSHAADALAEDYRRVIAADRRGAR